MVTASRKRPAPKNLAGFNPTANAGDCVYDHESAERAVKFFEVCLVHIKGAKAGQPFVLEKWQADITRTLFGWKRPDGTRRFRKAYIEVPRKNGKTTLVAGWMLYLLLCDGEPGAELYCAASDKKQAGLVFDIAASMVLKNPAFEDVCKVKHHGKEIRYKDSVLYAIPANADGAHGFNASAISRDEVHVWPGREFYDVLETSMGARTQPMAIDITTAGWDRNSVCWKQHCYAEQVRDGKVNDIGFLPAIYGVDVKADWTKEATWKRANPNYGISVSPEYLRAECEKAKVEPSYQNNFRRLHLNQWTSQKTRWLRIDQWRDCQTDNPIQPGCEVFGGLDLASTTDVAAFCLAAPTEGGGYRLRWRFWIPENAMREIERRDRVPYSEWAAKGIVHATPGDCIDYKWLESEIIEDAETYDIRYVGYDPWNAENTRQRLEEQGLEMVKVRQGVASLSEPSKELERCIRSGTLEHDGNPCAEWMAENVEVHTDANGNIRPVRPEHGASSRKIDGIVAAIMALSVAMVPSEPVPSYYEDNAVEIY